ncbi:MAG: hypothetical protein ACLFPQ_04220 [Candidatus Woesearchaeota archaeon]
MNFLKSKKADLGDIGEWIIPALIAFVLGAVAMYLMYKGIIPDFLGLFASAAN